MDEENIGAEYRKVPSIEVMTPNEFMLWVYDTNPGWDEMKVELDKTIKRQIQAAIKNIKEC